jgi:LysM repeat protein
MRPNSARMILAVVAAFFLILAAGGCARRQPPSVPGGEEAAPETPGVKAGPAKEPTYFIHTVKWPNESLSIIAAWYTGKVDNWKLLAQVNPDLDPNRIYIGDKIRIPEELMKTHEPPTRKFVDSLVRKSVKKAPTATEKPASGGAPPASQEPEIKLYGPKTTN